LQHQIKNIHAMLHKKILLVASVLIWCQCTNTPTANHLANEPERLTRLRIEQVRLHDGVPLVINADLHWQVSDQAIFGRYHAAPDSFPKWIMLPRAQEVLREYAHNFHSVDSVFFAQRTFFLKGAKQSLIESMQKDGVLVNDVLITSVEFPQSYVSAMEAAGLQRQEMERIKRQTAIAIAEAEGERKKTEAKAQIEIAQEIANAKVRDIQASTENKRRESELNRAETEVQLEAKKTITAAERQRQLDKVELEKVAGQNDLVVQKTQKLDQAEIDRNRELAKVYQEHPEYANFVVNKELAGKVSIAVVPPGQDQTVLNRFLDQTPKGKKD
jgi:regulator of protease activity HflC (stomatin/prohibitin superfamily)